MSLSIPGESPTSPCDKHFFVADELLNHFGPAAADNEQQQHLSDLDKLLDDELYLDDIFDNDYLIHYHILLYFIHHLLYDLIFLIDQQQQQQLDLDLDLFVNLFDAYQHLDLLYHHSHRDHTI
ncbi:hypothetical protein NEOLEDRAFT_1184172 [Neolentinus lepideus HHB14362 ss-1]|uniref:Uncharacterized protein n=1 Tax=Neolentinus lepideus HHB14362 ss-1 TaxID=1314782 RepID=A0A165MMN6_9AGAM|nr:hypothetical protein NEOLEDRAFT_1184172 [Neolentinus lepideus HHB14362 ss-1]